MHAFHTGSNAPSANSFWCSGFVHRQAQAAHARLLQPARQQLVLLGQRGHEPGHDAKALGILGRSRLGAGRAAIGRDAGRRDDGTVDSGFVHQPEHALGGHGIGQVRFRSRAPWFFRRIRVPDVDLCVGDHALLIGIGWCVDRSGQSHSWASRSEYIRGPLRIERGAGNKLPCSSGRNRLPVIDDCPTRDLLGPVVFPGGSEHERRYERFVCIVDTWLIR